jgi:hypothetical protein
MAAGSSVLHEFVTELITLQVVLVTNIFLWNITHLHRSLRCSHDGIDSCSPETSADADSQ